MKRISVVAVIVALVLVMGLLATLRTENLQAAPAAAPTPVSVTYAPSGEATLDFLRVPTAYTADFNTSALTILPFQATDIQYTIDQTAVSSVVNTTTLTLQFSNDNSNWVDGPAIASANTADASVMQQYAVFGRYARMKVDLSNANPITISVVAVGK
jgi:hypothetical protein